MEVVAQVRAGWQVVCGLCSKGSDRHKEISKSAPPRLPLFLLLLCLSVYIGLTYFCTVSSTNKHYQIPHLANNRPTESDHAMLHVADNYVNYSNKVNHACVRKKIMTVIKLSCHRHRHNLQVYEGYRNPHFLDWGTVPPLFETRVKNLQSSEAICRN